MKDKNYITILGWMTNQLKLSGNKLMVYAIIYGFSQDKESKFKGSAKYIAESLNISRQAVLTSFKTLLKDGLIIKHERNEKGIKWCDYEAVTNFISDKEQTPCKESLHDVKKDDRVCKESLQGACKESLHHNTNINKQDINSGSNEPSASFSQALELSNLLLTSHRKEFPDYLSSKDSKKIIESWANDIEKLIRIDKKPPETIRQVILWVKDIKNVSSNGFTWFHNIESGIKLRKQFERLYEEMTIKLQPKKTDPPERINYIPDADQSEKMLIEWESHRHKVLTERKNKDEDSSLVDDLKRIAKEKQEAV